MPTPNTTNQYSLIGQSVALGNKDEVRRRQGLLKGLGYNVKDDGIGDDAFERINQEALVKAMNAAQAEFGQNNNWQGAAMRASGRQERGSTAGVEAAAVGQTLTPQEMAQRGWTHDLNTGQSLDRDGNYTSAADPSWKNAAPLDTNDPRYQEFIAKNPQAAPGMQGINTGQPSPSTVQVGAGLPGSPSLTQPGGAMSQNLAQTAQQGFQQATASGQPAPSTQGQAMGMIQQTSALTPEVVDMSPVDLALSEDEGWQNLTKMYADYYSPENQKTSLMDTYNQLFKNSGLEKLDKDIVDAQTIIDGTEDDIRNEVEQAGGFGTDSQVQALSLSRNKVLLKNYNNLVAMRQSKQQSLDQQMNFAEKDRAYADSQFDRMVGYQEKMMNFREKFKQNTLDQYNKYEPAQLQAMLKDNPRQLQFAEKIMNLGPGGLKRLAEMPMSESDRLDMQYKKAQISNIYSQINERKNVASGQTGQKVTLTGRPQNASQAAANGYADRLAEANVVISNIGGKFTGRFDYGGSMPNTLQSGNRQSYEQSKRNFVTAILRRESGAAISPSEFDTAEKQYFPQAGDKKSTVAQKEKGRNTAINNIYREANVLRPVLPGQTIEADGKTYKVGMDGETLEEI